MAVVESYNGTLGKSRVLVEDNYNPPSLFLNLNSNEGLKGPQAKGRVIMKLWPISKTPYTYQVCMGALLS